MRPPKTDFRIVFYTPKKKHVLKRKKYPFFNAYKVKKKNTPSF